MLSITGGTSPFSFAAYRTTPFWIYSVLLGSSYLGATAESDWWRTALHPNYAAEIYTIPVWSNNSGTYLRLSTGQPAMPFAAATLGPLKIAQKPSGPTCFSCHMGLRITYQTLYSSGSVMSFTNVLLSASESRHDETFCWKMLWYLRDSQWYH